MLFTVICIEHELRALVSYARYFFYDSHRVKAEYPYYVYTYVKSKKGGEIVFGGITFSVNRGTKYGGCPMNPILG